jgi:hypothetical protein
VKNVKQANVEETEAKPVEIKTNQGNIEDNNEKNDNGKVQVEFQGVEVKGKIDVEQKARKDGFDHQVHEVSGRVDTEEGVESSHESSPIKLEVSTGHDGENASVVVQVIEESQNNDLDDKVAMDLDNTRSEKDELKEVTHRVETLDVNDKSE